MANNKKWVNWDKPVTILNLIGLVILSIFVATKFDSMIKSSKELSPAKSPGCFTFNDSTKQNWTLDQLYIAKPPPQQGQPQKKVESVIPGPPPTYFTYTPFILKNHQNIALEADTSFYLIADKNVKLCDIYFESPDLTSTPDWQNISGYSVDIRREFFSPCTTDPPDTFFAQLQVRVIDTTNNQEKLFAETEKVMGVEKFKFHEIKFEKPYHLVWKNSIPFSDQKYKVKQVRIRCSVPGYGMPGECAWRDAWKIGNVCPEK